VRLSLQSQNIPFLFDYSLQWRKDPRKSPGLLGITTSVAGLLGFPAPNGLIPQAPIHTTSLTIMGSPLKGQRVSGECSYHSRTLSRPSNLYEESDDPQPSVSKSFYRREVPVAVFEQRKPCTGPPHVLNLIPR